MPIMCDECGKAPATEEFQLPEPLAPSECCKKCYDEFEEEYSDKTVFWIED